MAPDQGFGWQLRPVRKGLSCSQQVGVHPSSKCARMEVPDSGAEQSQCHRLGLRSQRKKGRRGEWVGERNKGACGQDTHARQLLQLPKDKGQGSISSSHGSRRQQPSCFSHT